MRGRFYLDIFQPLVAAQDEEFPFSLVRGSSLYHCGMLSTYAAGLRSVRPAAWIEMHSQDGQRLNIQHQDLAVIRSRQGEISCEVIFNNSLPEGVVFVPDHFRETSVNKLTDNSFACQVHIQKIP